MSEILYPLKFKPIIKQTIWGGHKLNSQYGKGDHHGESVAESWEISAVGADDISEIINGPLSGQNLNQVLQKFGPKLVGQKVWDKFGADFPLLVKFIDAEKVLSVQVHPDDAIAQAKHGQRFGKNEFWYVMEAADDCQFVMGFNRDLKKEELVAAIQAKTLPALLNFVSVKAGDVMPIPPGTVHAIGSGALLVEIQQSSDTTYRFYDWDRVDATGKPRELHQELALEAVTLTPSTNPKTSFADPERNLQHQICANEHFQVNLYHLDQALERDFASLDSFLILVCTEGTLEVTVKGAAETNTIILVPGETCLIPAALGRASLTPVTASTKFLEAHL